MNYSDADALTFLSTGIAFKELPEKLCKRLDGLLSPTLEEAYMSLAALSEAGALSGDADLTGSLNARLGQWRSLFADEISQSAREQIASTGTRHEDSNVPISFYIASYGWLMMRLVPLLQGSGFGVGRKEQSRLICTMIHRLFAEMVLSISSYHERALERARNGPGQANNDTLANVARSISETNSILLQLAMLQRSARKVTESSQTISSATIELVASVKEISGNSETASQEAAKASETTHQGRTAIDQMSATITNISQTVEKTSDNVGHLSGASDQIGQILGVIEDIAEQTNLLALNATIEAARAGDVGKGFAVVAAEVKNLANQTSKATEDIATRVSSLRRDMLSIEQTMQASTQAVEEGESALDEALTHMGGITDQVQCVSGRMMEISGILSQQEGASQDIAQSIHQVAQSASHSEQMVENVATIMDTTVKNNAAYARELFDDGSDLALCYMAKIDHVLFKQRAIDTCMGNGDWQARDVPDEHTCRLGKWYDSLRDDRIKALPAYKALDAPHHRVHDSAKRALTCAAKDDHDGMMAALSELDESSNQVLVALDDLAVGIKELEGFSPSHRQDVRRSA